MGFIVSGSFKLMVISFENILLFLPKIYNISLNINGISQELYLKINMKIKKDLLLSHQSYKRQYQQFSFLKKLIEDNC